LISDSRRGKGGRAESHAEEEHAKCNGNSCDVKILKIHSTP